MCLILFSYQNHPRYHLILAANRDEFYDRPSAPLQSWKDHDDVLAGRDLRSMGTWMGITRTGRWAAITNYREPGMTQPDAPSRGHLVADFLIGDLPPATYLGNLRDLSKRYNGFNLLVGDPQELAYYSNRRDEVIRLKSGIYGLSNRHLDSRWPKVDKGKSKLAELINHHDDLPAESIMELLTNQQTPPDHQLPDTGIGVEWERILSPIFIASPNYGTRCSTLLTIDNSHHVTVIENTWTPGYAEPTLRESNTYDFALRRPPHTAEG